MNEQDAMRQEPTREDVLIGRVTDGEATPNDWQELERIACEDDGVWSRLATAQRAHARLSEAVDDQIAVCELVDLPKAPGKVGALLVKGAALTGWGVAAALALTVFTGGQSGMAVEPGGSVGNTAGPAVSGVQTVSFDDARDQYIEAGRREGRVLRELPSKMVDTRGLGEGNGRGVLYVRMFLEQAQVDEMDLLDIQQMENGEPMPVRMRVPDGYRSNPI